MPLTAGFGNGASMRPKILGTPAVYCPPAISIYAGDYLPGLRSLKDKSVDFIVTDPLHGVGIARRGLVGRSALWEH